MPHVELALKNVGLPREGWAALPSQAPDLSGASLTPSCGKQYSGGSIPGQGPTERSKVVPMLPRP